MYLGEPLRVVVSAGCAPDLLILNGKGIRVDGKSLDEGVNSRGGKSGRKSSTSSRILRGH